MTITLGLLLSRRRSALTLALLFLAGSAADAVASEAIYRCPRPGQAPLFSAVPCGPNSGPGERLGEAVIQQPKPHRLARPWGAEAPHTDIRTGPDSTTDR